MTDDTLQDSSAPATQALPVNSGLSPKEKSAVVAQLSLSPSMQSALTIGDYSTLDGANYSDLVRELDKTLPPIHGGDFSQVESLMWTQAIALNSIFGHLCRKALTAQGYRGMSEYLELGLKAQRQSRNTLEDKLDSPGRLRSDVWRR